MARTRGHPRLAARGRGISNRNAANAIPPTDFRPTSSTADLTPPSRSPLRGSRGKTTTSNKPKSRGRKPGLNAALRHLQQQLFNGPKELGIKNGENRDYIPGLGFVFSSNQQPEEPSEVQEFVEDEENMGVLETYERYKPSKLTLGLDHPDVVVETSSLAGVSPPDIHYKICIPETTINKCLLSSLQLESIFYACQQHDKILPNGQRAGFLIGDGAGVGKGRTVAGVIFENFLRGRKKAIWISISSDLKYDAERDLRDIGAHRVNVHALNKMKYAPISSEVNGCIKDGVIFSTYSSLISETHAVSGLRSRLDQLVDWCGQDFDGVIIFDECHKAKNLLPSGSAKGTKTGAAVVKLQDCLPKARVVYASATGASEPRNMAYMTRLGLWGEGTPFKDFHEFLTLVDRRGVGIMEVVAMEMKLRGMYIARQLSFEGVRFSIDEVPLTPELIELYDKCVALWMKLFRAFREGARLMLLEKREQKTMWGQFWSSHQRFFKYLCIAAKVERVVHLAEEAVKDGKCVVIGLQSTGEARTLDQLGSDGELSDFVSSAKGVLQALVDKHFPVPANFESFSLLCDNSEPLLEWPALNKAENQVKRKELAFSSVKEESCSKKLKTDPGMEQSFKYEDFDILDEDGDVKQPVVSKKKEWYDSDSDSSDIETKVQKAVGFQINGPGSQVKGPRVAPRLKAPALKKELMADIETLAPHLPTSTLDQLINDLGGKENVAEMTGRKGRIVENGGQIIYELRAESDIPLEILNIREKERFMNGEKLIAIISEAASSGISLQADRRALNQRQRVHITLELPWSADRAIQQFGRTHRSNQVSAPYYIFLISDLAGERRFASAVAKRLESLGALTHGDRRATETRDLSQFNVDNRYGNEALRTVMNAVLNIESPLVQPPADYQGNFFKDVRTMLEGVGLVRNSENDDADVPEQEDVTTMDKKATSIPRFLNRILGLPVDLQNRLFKYFTDTLDAVIEKAKRENRYDRGILDLGSGDQDVIDVELYTLPRKLSTGVANTEIHVVDVQRGMKWEKAEEKFLKMRGEHEGFYSWGGKFGGQYRSAVLVELTNKTRSMGRGREEPLYTIYKPNLGHQVKPLTLPEIRINHKKITRTEAELLWKSHYEESKTVCSHRKGKCPTASGVRCEYGLSQCRRNILRGSVLTVWTKVEAVVSKAMGGLRRMQVIRLRGGKTILVGTLIPHSCLKQVMGVISEEAEEVKHVLLSNS